MPKRIKTDEKLAAIASAGRRASLTLDDEYLSTEDHSSPLETPTEEKPSLPTAAHVERQLRQRKSKTGPESAPEAPESDKKHEQYARYIREINSRNLRRLNGRPDKDSAKYKSRFGDIKFATKLTTIFDATYFKNSEFFGLYVLFWLGTAFMMFNSLVHGFFESRESLFELPVFQTLKKDIFLVGLTDSAMYMSTYVAYFLQVACLRGWIRWERAGHRIQVIYDFVNLAFWLYFASEAWIDFPWIAKVFLLLHNLVFVMKMHSYGFYNGYLWRIMHELESLQKLLDGLESGDMNVRKGVDREAVVQSLLESITFCKFELDYQSNATTLNADITVDPADIDDDIASLQKRNVIKFPQNINLRNFFEYSMFPTVVYTLNFPRTPRIRWKYVVEKVLGIFGIIFLMILVAQGHLYPLVVRAKAASVLLIKEKIVEYLFILLDMMPPFLLIYLLTFFLIWDAILNSIAELSCFADRDFYGPWWSCTDWSEFSRIWNRPVHKFLLRHVYHSSISALHMSKTNATLFTFMLSSLVHELVMFVIFGRLRGYLLLLQMSQLPLIMISRTPFMRDKKVLGNIICWFGFISGPSLICTAYLIF